MGPRHGDFEHPLDPALTEHVVQVGVVDGLAGQERLGVGAFDGGAAGAGQKRGRLAQRGGGQHLEAGDESRFAGVGAGHQQSPQAAAMGALRHGQHARDRADRAVEAELADGRGAGQRAAALPGRAEQGEGDRQVERRPLLAHVGRREVRR